MNAYSHTPHTLSLYLSIRMYACMHVCTAAIKNAKREDCPAKLHSEAPLGLHEVVIHDTQDARSYLTLHRIRQS